MENEKRGCVPKKCYRSTTTTNAFCFPHERRQAAVCGRFVVAYCSGLDLSVMCFHSWLRRYPLRPCCTATLDCCTTGTWTSVPRKKTLPKKLLQEGPEKAARYFFTPLGRLCPFRSKHRCSVRLHVTGSPTLREIAR